MAGSPSARYGVVGVLPLPYTSDHAPVGERSPSALAAILSNRGARFTLRDELMAAFAYRMADP